VKLRSLKLERFGHFQGATLELGQGLQMLWGRNEAGKSTLVAALRALLFKYPAGQYDFRFPDSTLAISASLEFADGSVAEVRREKNKGWKAQLDGEKLSDDDFKDKLGRPSQELFANVFAFGLLELERGAESIQEAGLGAAISGAAVGVQPDALLAELRKQAEELYSERASKRPINQLAGEIRDLKKQLRESQLPGERFLALQNALSTSQGRGADLRARREILLRRSNTVETALRALPAKQALAGARLDLERLGTTVGLPPTAEPEYQRLRGDRDRLGARTAELEGKLARTHKELESLVDPPSAAADARLPALTEAWSGDAQRREQLDDARTRCDKLSQEKQRLRARLDPPWKGEPSGARRGASREAVPSGMPLPEEGELPLPVPRVEEVRRHKKALDDLSRVLDTAKHDRERAARELAQAAEQAEKKAGEAPSADELGRLRSERDAVWERIRKSWLEGALTGGEGSGALFARSSERQLAASLVNATRAADDYADKLRDKATDVAAALEAAARRDEKIRALEAAERDVKDAAAAAAEGEDKWRALWSRCGFLPHSPDAMLEWLADYHALVDTTAQLEAAAAGAARLEQATRDYQAQLRAVIGGDGAVDALHAEARRRLQEESEREQQRIRAAEARRRLRKSAEELTHDLGQTRTQLDARNAELAAWRARAQAGDDDAFGAAAAAARQAHELSQEIARHERTLAEAQAGVADLDEALARGRELLAAEQKEIAAERAQLEEELTETAQQVGATGNELKRLDGSSRAVELVALLEAKRAELRDKATEWARLAAARSLLERQLQRFSAREQPRLLESVARLFSAMTRGRYLRVYQRLDDKRTFMAVRADGTEVEPAALSSGTREQLYLALRLAYIDAYCARSEPLPLCLDDVLVNFDDERAAATLGVLHRLAAEDRTQLLFLTCHAHLVELAKKTLPSVHPIELPPAG
jgi:uncharacterized protein YhaN